MLAELTVKDFALIDELALSFDPGLNIVTGETGAGKSIIIEAINLLVGGRADTSRIRHGAEAAEINGLFILGDQQEHALRRLLSRDGRSRSFIDGRPVTTGQLSDLGDTLLDIHGQHEHQVLLSAHRHLDLIDRFGGEDIRLAKEAFAKINSEYKKRLQEASDMKAAETSRSDRIDLLTWHTEELSAAALTIGEDEELEAKISRMKNGAKIFEAVDKARRAIDDMAVDGAQTALAEINRVVDADRELAKVVGSLEAAGAHLEESARLIRDYCRELSYDESDLESCQERLFMLSDLKKKYGLSIEGLIAYLDSARAELAEKDGVDSVEDIARDIDRLSAETSAAAEILSSARLRAAERFAGLVKAHLRDLAMTGAQFSVKFQPFKTGSALQASGSGGHDSAEFLFSANAGEPLRPLARIASGGELSRVMLAIRSVFGNADATPTLVFDEIDAGIGGKVAVKVGERLSALGESHQVVCVTHLAQIAAFGDYHLAVVKSEADGRTSLEVKPISGDERLVELSRLGGALNESEISVEHARELLRQAQLQKSTVST